MVDDGVISGPIVRDGKVAMFCHYCNDQEVHVNDRIYNFINRAGVTLAWINEADIPYVQEVTRKCCGGRKTQRMFHFANSAQVAYWEERG